MTKLCRYTVAAEGTGSEVEDVGWEEEEGAFFVFLVTTFFFTVFLTPDILKQCQLIKTRDLEVQCDMWQGNGRVLLHKVNLTSFYEPIDNNYHMKVQQ